MNQSLIFKELKDEFQKNFEEKTKNINQLFVVDLDKDEFWETYLNAYPSGTNEIYRERKEMDCSACRTFVKQFGNVVYIEDNKIKSIWDFKSNNDVFQIVIDSLSKYIYNINKINDIYLAEQNKVGTDYNFEEIKGQQHKWEHFFLDLPDKFVNKNRSKSIATLQSKAKSKKEVFKRSLEEISYDAINEVIELSQSKTLYKGVEWIDALKLLIINKQEYDSIPDENKDNWLWFKSVEVSDVLARMKNHSIGTLLVDLTDNMNINEAVKKYEAIVAPENYKRPKAIYTQRMLNEAKENITNLGYIDSLPRRFAVVDDITANNVLFIDVDTVKEVSGDIFDEMQQDIPLNPKQFDRCEEINIEDFIKDVLPTATSIEVFVENRHTSNLVSLIAPINDSPSLFKWDNPYSWSYIGNITDSSIKQMVEQLGGNISGVLRGSLGWNDGKKHIRSDLDIHCREPNGNVIYYHNMRSHTGGNLDVDIIDPLKGKMAVENIAYPSKNNMLVGKYQFLVHCYSSNGGNEGFKAEIEADGETYQFEHNKELKSNEKVPFANVTLNEDGKFTVEELIKSYTSSNEIWNIKTNNFVPVKMIMFSPNCWDEKEIGNKHYFIMLKDCLNDETPNGFYNEFLKNDLITHKRFFEALGSKMKIEKSNEQLSGLGFSSTKRNDIIVKVKGHTERILKIKV